ncbi:MAG: T9SS type A sorting domain-containing protein [Bacteroidia bacterium]
MKRILIVCLVLCFLGNIHFMTSQSGPTLFLSGSLGTWGNCSGQALITTCGSYTVSWAGNGGPCPPPGNAIYIPALCTGTTYTVYVSNSSTTWTCCFNYSTTGLILTNSDTSLTVKAAFIRGISSTSTSPCNGMVVLDTSGYTSPSIIWQDSTGAIIPGQSNDTFLNVCSGNYSCIVTDGGCSSNTPNFLTFRLPYLHCEIETTPVSCSGDCNGKAKLVILSWNQLISQKSISSGVQNSSDSIMNLCTGQVTASVIDQTGASTICTNTITSPAVFVNSIDSVLSSAANNGQIYITTQGGTPPIIAYLDNTDSIEYISGQTIFDSLAPGSYFLSIVDSSGCSFFDSVQVPALTGKSEIDSEKFEVYPNPSENYIFIKSVNDKKGNLKILIFNSFGKVVLEQMVHVMQEGTTVDPSSIEQGIYTYKLIYNNSSSRIEKLIIIK